MKRSRGCWPMWSKVQNCHFIISENLQSSIIVIISYQCHTMQCTDNILAKQCFGCFYVMMMPITKRRWYSSAKWGTSQMREWHRLDPHNKPNVLHTMCITQCILHTMHAAHNVHLFTLQAAVLVIRQPTVSSHVLRQATNALVSYHGNPMTYKIRRAELKKLA